MDKREELDFMFDEEMEELNINRKTFTKWTESDSEDEVTDADIRKILIVTQVGVEKCNLVKLIY